MIWLVSVPYDKSEGNAGKKAAYEHLNRKLAVDKKLCDCYEFLLPSDLKPGDSYGLITLAEDLAKYDSQIEQMATKALRINFEMSEVEEKDFSPMIVRSNGPTDEVTNLEPYLQYFKWDDAQFRTNLPLKDIVKQLMDTCIDLDEELKTKQQDYLAIKSNIQSLLRKKDGNLMVKPLDGLIKEEHIVETEYLSTKFVVVPLAQEKQFLSNYESFCEMVVPDSAFEIERDSEYILYAVSMIKKLAEHFVENCKDNRYIVRNFEFDEERFNLAQEEEDKLFEKRHTQRTYLRDMSTVVFSQTFTSWIHLKAIRVFVESVLRYGVGQKFVVALLRVNRNLTKIHRILKKEYSYLADDNFSEMMKFQETNPLPTPYGLEMHPYVLLTLNTDDHPLLKL